MIEEAGVRTLNWDGCVNVRDYNGMAWLFDQVRTGDKVIVYWS